MKLVSLDYKFHDDWVRFPHGNASMMTRIRQGGALSDEVWTYFEAHAAITIYTRATLADLHGALCTDFPHSFDDIPF